MYVVDDIFVRSLIAIPDKEIIYYFAAWCAGIQIRVRGYVLVLQKVPSEDL